MKQSINYLYVYLDPRRPGKYSYSDLDVCFIFEPFYIGKSKNKKRMRAHLTEAFSTKAKERNIVKCRKIRSIYSELGILPYIIVVKDYLAEDEANKEEIKFISSIGRLDFNSGPLTNLTMGGDGVTDKIFTEEYRKRLSVLRTGIKQSEESKKLKSISCKDFWTPDKKKLRSEKYSGKFNPMYGKTQSKESIDKNRASNSKYIFTVISDNQKEDFNSLRNLCNLFGFNRPSLNKLFRSADIVKYKTFTIERKLNDFYNERSNKHG